MFSARDIELSDRFIACFLGAAIGDALASPFEGASPRALDVAHAPDIARRFISRGNGIPPGSYSDDTYLFHAISGAISEVGSIDGHHVATVLLETIRNGSITRTDSAYIDSMRSFAAGVPWTACGKGLNSDTAAVRAAPVGLFFCESQRSIPESAKRQALCTHQGEIAIAGAVAMASAVAMAVTQNSDESPIKFCTALAAVVRPYSSTFARHIDELPSQLSYPRETAALLFANKEMDCRAPKQVLGMTNNAVGSVLLALYSYLKYKTDFRGCMEAVIRAGGNICSIACMAGALFGARYGMKCLPGNLVNGVAYQKAIIDNAKSLFMCRPTASGPKVPGVTVRHISDTSVESRQLSLMKIRR